MNKYLIVLFVVYLCSNVNCVKLENLCEKFDYKGLEVNSFYQVKWNLRLENVGRHAINENLDYSKILNKTDAETANKIRDEFNALVIDLYSEEYINSDKLKTIENEKEKILKLKNQMNLTLDNLNEYNKFKRHELLCNFDRTIKLIDTFVQYRKNTVNQCDDRHNYNQNLRWLLENLKIEKDQTFVLRDESIKSIYKQPIQKFEKFTFVRASETYYDFSSYGYITYSITLPFNNKNYQAKPCTSSKTLPPFFNKTN